MLKKLRWEINQYNLSHNRKDETVYYAINGALTAWHLYDWTWGSIKNNRILLTRMAAERQVPFNKFGKESLGAWAADKSFGVGYCQIIATAAKHTSFDFRSGDSVSIETVVSGSSDLFDDIADFDAEIAREWNPKLVVDGERIAMSTILVDAETFWKKFCKEYVQV